MRDPGARSARLAPARQGGARRLDGEGGRPRQRERNLGELLQIGSTLLAYDAGSLAPPPPPQPRPQPEVAPVSKPDKPAEPTNPHSVDAEPSEVAGVFEEPGHRHRSEWLLAIAGVIALGIATAAVLLVVL
jgi:hypothetical protein